MTQIKYKTYAKRSIQTAGNEDFSPLYSKAESPDLDIRRALRK